MRELSNARIAVVHDWLIDYAGAERALAEILRCFPQADLFALIDHMPGSERAALGAKRATTTFMQRLPGVATRLGYYLPLMPLAIEQLDVTGYDLVISSSHAVAKGVIVSPDALHVSYVYSPMRYAWDQQFNYLRDKNAGGGLKGALLRWTLHRLRIWDHRSAAGVDRFVADSHFIARRILKAYRRDSVVIYPPVDTGLFTPGSDEREPYYVTVSRLMPYKRVDLLVEAFARMPGRRLLVIGAGPEYARLKGAATANVEFAGHLPAHAVIAHLQRARAFLFAAVEDFGIAPVEAMACGTPVIALRQGGAAETVAGPESDEPTGAFFEEQSAGAVAAAVEDFENRAPISVDACRRRALGFSAERFRGEFTAFVERAYADWRSGSRP